MRPAKKKERDVAKAMAGLAEMMASAGLATAGITQENAKEAARDAIISKPPPIDDAEAVLKFLRSPAAFAFKHCKSCSQEFGTDYRAVAYCSDLCRSKALAQLGIQWDPHKPQQVRWGSEQSPVEPPQILPPAALSVLLKIAIRQGQIREEEVVVPELEVSSTSSSFEFALPTPAIGQDTPLLEKEEVVPEKTSPHLPQSPTFQFGDLMAKISFGS